MKERLKILKIWVDNVTMSKALAYVELFLKNCRRPHFIVAVNPEKNFSIHKDKQLYKTVKEADLLIPDGIGIILAARILYGVRLSRVTGIELMEKICELAQSQGYKIFIYGAREEINKNAVNVLLNRYPRLAIVGRANGYLKDEEMCNLIEEINISQAEILFLALGSPKQEKWFSIYKNRLKNIKVCQGIGGTLDTISGNVKRAPILWQKYFVEWLYRLLTDPQRIKRQKVLPIFIFMIIVTKLTSIAGFKVAE
ncbi:MAG: WecB/TagA/CpsF family glycosyltransferase [bacterium]